MIKLKPQPNMAFEWPEFNSEVQRVKHNTEKYFNLSVIEAFEKAYNITVTEVSEEANNVQGEIKIGDVLNLNVLSINKNNVKFDSGNYGAPITSAVNLHRYERFKHNIPNEPIKALVMNITKDNIIVDPLAPVINDYLNPILTDKNTQKVMGNPKTIRVKDLRLVKGGFSGKAILKPVSEFVGEEYAIDVFIPGSQIVLNITNDFEQFVGKEVDVFIINYIQKPNTPELSLIASAKEVIKFNGECNLIKLFNSWCEESKLWNDSKDIIYEGKVTGIINSSKKCGVFVEIPGLSITGLVQVKSEELVNYKVNSDVQVKLTGFDEERKFNPITKQLEHVEPYIIENGCLVRCNIKPVLSFVE